MHFCSRSAAKVHVDAARPRGVFAAITERAHPSSIAPLEEEQKRMEALPDAARHAAAIRNACWMVRHYARPLARVREQRAQAIWRLGLTVREAFNSTEEFEPLLCALVEGLRPHDPPPF